MAETILDLARRRSVTATGGVSRQGVMLSMSDNAQAIRMAGAADLSFAGPFCVEWYGSVSAMPAAGHLLSGYSLASTGVSSAFNLTYIPSNNKLLAGCHGSESSIERVTPLIGTGRHYIAMDRGVDNMVRLFFDGVLIGTAANSGAAVSVVGPSGGTVDIGRSAYGFNGYVGELGWCRMTNASRYTADYEPLVPVTLADPFWSQTVLLIVAGNSTLTGLDIPPRSDGLSRPQASLALWQVDRGVFDLEWFEPMRDDDSRYIQTLVYAALFTDAEAPAAREPDRYLRRGWWRDPSAGSGLWHIRRQPLGSTARREAVEAVRGALEAYGLTDVSVTERGPVGVSSVVLEVSGLYRDRPFLVSVPL